MRTEHLQNLRLNWVITGWLVAVAVSAFLVLSLAGLGLLGADPATDALWAVVTVAIGFWFGGLFIGFRTTEAPILHGVGIGLTSLVAWFLVNVFVNVPFGEPRWQGLDPTLTAAILLEQIVAAVAGAWVGHRIALRGGAELSEE
jgi:hypothetical protein